MCIKHVPEKSIVPDALSRRPDLAVVVLKQDELDGLLQHIREAQKAASSDPKYQKYVEYAK